MPSASKRPDSAPYVKWNVTIDAALAARVEMSNWDAAHQKPKYGSRRLLIESLLTDWLDRQAAESIPQ